MTKNWGVHDGIVEIYETNCDICTNRGKDKRIAVRCVVFDGPAGVGLAICEEHLTEMLKELHTSI